MMMLVMMMMMIIDGDVDNIGSGYWLYGIIYLHVFYSNLMSCTFSVELLVWLKCGLLQLLLTCGILCKSAENNTF